MAFAVGALDEAVREYLLYRGFTQTLKFFEAERRDDRDKGFSFKVRGTRPARRGAGLRGMRINWSALQCVVSSAGEPDCGLHNAVRVQVRLCQPPELLVVPVRSFLQPDEQRVAHHGLQTGDQRSQVCLWLSTHTTEPALCGCRLFLVQASKTGRQEEVRTFFEKMSDSLHDRKEWKDWFGEPHSPPSPLPPPLSSSCVCCETQLGI